MRYRSTSTPSAALSWLSGAAVMRSSSMAWTRSSDFSAMRWRALSICKWARSARRVATCLRQRLRVLEDQPDCAAAACRLPAQASRISSARSFSSLVQSRPMTAPVACKVPGTPHRASPSGCWRSKGRCLRGRTCRVAGRAPGLTHSSSHICFMCGLTDGAPCGTTCGAPKTGCQARTPRREGKETPIPDPSPAGAREGRKERDLSRWI